MMKIEALQLHHKVPSCTISFVHVSSECRDFKQIKHGKFLASLLNERVSLGGVMTLDNKTNPFWMQSMRIRSLKGFLFSRKK